MGLTVLDGIAGAMAAFSVGFMLEMPPTAFLTKPRVPAWLSAKHAHPGEPMRSADLRLQRDFLSGIASLDFVEQLFDSIIDIVYSVKDRQGRYIVLSQAAASRCGLRRKQDAVGLTAYDLFPAPMADRYSRQDQRLFATGRPIIDNLDLTIYRDGSTGWCLSTKQPLYDRRARIVGLACLSRDLHEPDRSSLIDSGFADAVDYLHEHFDQRLRIEDLALRARMSPAQFDRRMRKLFQMSTARYLMRKRIDLAAHLLADSHELIADIAQQAGFGDQAALSRLFRQVTGFTPRQYRQLHRGERPVG